MDARRAIAAELQKTAQPGDRALLVYPAGLEFISAFFGCILAGVMPVPATYPKPRRPMPRLSAIHADCGATLALTTAQTLETLDLAQTAPDLLPLRWIATDAVAADAEDWKRPSLEPSDVAFLQYTSGSTSQPKGVAVTHRNLLHNLELIRLGFDVPGIHADGRKPVGVSWLPLYHDMGLIGGVFNTLYNAFHTYLLTPTSFLQRPIVWLEAITKYGGTITGAPNFAYDLCVAKVAPADRVGLDLSSVRLSLCAAEPIRARTLKRFAEAFGECGFREDAFYPCYGLAESTLLAAGPRGPARPLVKNVCRVALEKHEIVPAAETDAQSQQLVACGGNIDGQRVIIVDPQTRRPLSSDKVGEIWIGGPSVARGYWNRPEETGQVFGARVDGDDETNYLRSGDLGFLSDDRLYVTGRLKDMIIVRGRNHYPQDIEQTACSSHDALQPNGAAAFAVEVDDQEGLVVVAEVKRPQRDANFDEVLRAIRAAVTRDHEVDAHSIVLIRPASLPRTTSGKIQRSLCRKKLLEGDLKIVARWTATPPRPSTAPTPSINGSLQPSPNATPLSAAEVDRLAERVEARLLTWLAERTGASMDDVDPHKPLAEYGLDSLAVVEMSHELESWLHIRIPVIAAWNYPTPSLLARFLAQQTSGSDAEVNVDVSQSTVSHSQSEFEQLLAEIERLDDDEVQAALDDRDVKP